jgi:hypothetical protein
LDENRDLRVDWMDWRMRRSGAGRVVVVGPACDADSESGMRSVDEGNGVSRSDGGGWEFVWRSEGAAFSLLLLEGTGFGSVAEEVVGFGYCC